MRVKLEANGLDLNLQILDGMGRVLIAFSLVLLVLGCNQKQPLASQFQEKADDQSSQLPPGASPTPTPAPPPPSNQPKFVFDVPDEFVSQPSLGTQYESRVTKFNVPKSETFSRVVIKAQIFNGGWTTFTDSMGLLHHYHSLFWMNRGNKWSGHVVGYMIAREKTHKMHLCTSVDNFSIGPGCPGNPDKDYRSFFVPGKWYNMEFVYDASGKKITAQLTDPLGQIWTFWSPTQSTNTVLTNPYNFYEFHFGQGGSGVGPDAPTEGWRIKNLRAEFYP